MSAPAMKALSPAPVRMTPRTEASFFTSSKAVCKSVQVGVFSALSTLGRSIVTYAIDPFFSYRTLASANAVLGEDSGTVAGDDVIDTAPEVMVTSPGKRRPARSRRRVERSREGADAGDSLADDQILHLIRAFIGVQRFTIREEACRLVVGNDSVAADQLAGPGNRLAAFGGSECLGKRGMGVRQLTFGMQLRLAHDQALRSRDIGDHFGEKVLDQLERRDRLAKLQALLAILQRGLISAHRASSRHPRHGEARHLQYLRGVAE